MKIELGIKTDCIETRYSFPWLFDLLVEEGIPFIQLGTFYEFYNLDFSYFEELREAAEIRNLKIKSVFTAHRELGGFFVGDKRFEKVARKGYERLIEIAGILGADYAGSNPGAIYRDQDHFQKLNGTEVYLRHLKELSRIAKKSGLKGLSMEYMSCLAEPPSTPDEIDYFMTTMKMDHEASPNDTVPTYLCGDISHGLCDPHEKILHSNEALFRKAIPFMCEFHFKNTDALFNSTFGFSPSEQSKGIVNLKDLKYLCETYASRWPVDDVVGYLEIMGPKIGRDYSDSHLAQSLKSSLRAIKEVFA